MNKTEIPKLKDSAKQFKRLLFLIKPYWGKLTKGFSLSILIGLIGMLTPYLTKLLIDNVYPSKDVTLMHVLVGGILSVSIVSSLISVIQGYFNLYINSRISNAASLMFFNHLQHLKMRFFDNHRVGEIMSRFGDVNKSLNSLNKVFQTIFVNGVYLIFVPPFLFLLNWKLATVALISLPLTIIAISITGKFLRKYWKKTSEAFAELNAFQFEMLSNIRALKSMLLENYVYTQNKNQIENAIQLQLKAGGLGQLLGLSNGVLSALNTALFTWLGWTFIIEGQLTLGGYIAFTSYIGYLYRPLREFVNLYSEFQQSSVNLHRMFEYLDSPTEIDPTSSYKKFENIETNISGNIKIQNLSFGYNEKQDVLKNINITIKNNSTIAIVGLSGSGKTTLLRLIIRMEIQNSGDIYFDNVNVNSIPIQELRKQISVIWQEFSMFKGTIRENLIIGLEDVEDSKINTVLKIARVDDLINSLPEGINTQVAEWGNSLSGGQRQRLAIARALLRDTPILIFDEATSNIDLKTENEILKDIFSKLNTKTIIYVTHRLATAAFADEVIFLDKGELVDNGKHIELLTRCEKYKELNNSHIDKSESIINSFNN